MSSMKLGFKQSLLLVVVLTTLGFGLLSYLSLNALNSQNQAAAQVDRLGRWVIGLSNLKADVSTASRLAGAGAEAELGQLLQGKQALLADLKRQGLPAADGLATTLSGWVAARQRALQAIAQIGLSNDDGQRAEVIGKLDAFEKSIFSFMRQPFRVVKDAVYQVIEQRSGESLELYAQAMRDLRKNLQELDFLEAFEEQLAGIDQVVQQLGTLVAAQRAAEAEAETHLATLNGQVESRLEQVLAQLAGARSTAEAAGTRARLTILLAGVAVALVSVLLLLMIWQRSSRSLGATVASLERIAAGDLALRMPVNQGRQDEFDRLGSAVNHLTQQLGGVLNGVKGSSDQLQRMSLQLSDTLNVQVRESEQVASDTSSVAAAVEEISQTVAEMARASEETNRLSSQAQQATDKGGVVITDALGSLELLSELFNTLHRQLNELSAASARVDGVTEMINGLAEQTNLLALNAAIEAARAGEAGRGFSVVADEVRALAEKTVAATAGINGIVTDMQTQLKQILAAMEGGQSQVEGGRRRGSEAVNEIGNIRQLFGEVGDRNQQQAASIEQIAATAQAIAQSMSSVHDNVARGSDRSREIGSFSTEVVGHTETLLEMTHRFSC